MKLALTQTLAIFRDAYRELNSKRMFWIVLLLSAVVVCVIAALGIHETTSALGSHQQRVTLFGIDVPFPVKMDRRTLYRGMFTELGVNHWLDWAAMVLAVISTAGIFPDFVTTGSIELYLSRPISRLRLFFTKYAAGLLFVTLQAGVFCLGSFLAIGLRADLWEPAIFWAIPLVVCIFSYLFSVSVLVGLLTRSTMSAILLTLLFWLSLFLIHFTDQGFLKEHLDDARKLAFAQRALDSLERAPTTPPATTRSARAAQQAGFREMQRQRAMQDRDDAQADLLHLRNFERIVWWAQMALPKTYETNLLMVRAMKFEAVQAMGNPWDFSDDLPMQPGPMGVDFDLEARAKRVMMQHSLLWVLGSSLAFEAVILAIGAAVFCRRDF